MNQFGHIENRRVLGEWNLTVTDVPPASCFHELIEQKAAELPDFPALICKNQELTYGELDKRANQLASYLRKIGIGPEVVVGISVERSLDMVIGLLGILKAGGAYLPLDPQYPADRLAFMIRDAGVQVLITQNHLISRLSIGQTRSLRLDTDLHLIQHEPTERLAQRNKPSDLAYVIYTSGSSGRPKGVMVEHRNVLNFLEAMNERVPHGPDSTWLAVTSPSFDISVLELFWTLSRGFKVVIHAEDEFKPARSFSGNGDRAHNRTLDSERQSSTADPADYSIASLIERHGVTHLQCTPSMASMLLLDARARKALSHLEALLIGGETFPVNLAQQLSKIIKGSILNMYGPTETTIWSTTYELPRGTSSPSRIPVGRPVANTQIYIVDDNLRSVPVGVAGELLIGGAGVARGYLMREQLTAERFIANPFPGTRAPRLYRTGDLARCLKDGNIEVLGRIDQQVKIRGHRVELGEIEFVLNQHPTVRESVVLLRELANGDKVLVAYLLAGEGQKPTTDQLRQHVQAKLPEHMIPSHFMFMTAFPQTPNRKIDRNAFPPPDTELRDDQAAIEQPVTGTEEVLAGIWKQLLALQRVGRQANFFEVGGHSMRALQLVELVRQRFHVDLTLRNIFERQTLAGMAEVIDALSWSKFAKSQPAGEREVVDV